MEFFNISLKQIFTRVLLNETPEFHFLGLANCVDINEIIKKIVDQSQEK